MEPVEQKPWRFEIKYGPEGEANYAWVYDHNNEMVCTAKTYHAKQIVERVTSPPPAAGWNEATIEDMVDHLYDIGIIHEDSVTKARNALESEALRREAPAPEGVADSDLDAKIAALAHRFWSIHPSSVDDMGLTREQFYVHEITKLIKAVRG